MSLKSFIKSSFLEHFITFKEVDEKNEVWLLSRMPSQCDDDIIAVTKYLQAGHDNSYILFFSRSKNAMNIIEFIKQVWQYTQ